MQSRANEYLEYLAGRLTAKGIRAVAKVRIGDPSREILAAVAEEKVDLIAMTTHGRSGLGRLLFGSVAENLLRSAPVPVLLLRMTKEALKMPVSAAGERSGNRKAEKR
jgi:nucleotide-binding universal stress UspA family protein